MASPRFDAMEPFSESEKCKIVAVRSIVRLDGVALSPPHFSVLSMSSVVTFLPPVFFGIDAARCASRGGVLREESRKEARMEKKGSFFNIMQGACGPRAAGAAVGQ
jgi:hypothetical protein